MISPLVITILGVVGTWALKLMVQVLWGLLTDPISNTFYSHARAWARRHHSTRSPLKCPPCREQLTAMKH